MPGRGGGGKFTALFAEIMLYSMTAFIRMFASFVPMQVVGMRMRLLSDRTPRWSVGSMCVQHVLLMRMLFNRLIFSAGF